METATPSELIGLEYSKLAGVLRETCLLTKWGAFIAIFVGAALTLSGLERKIGKRLLMGGLIIWIAVLVL